MNDKSICRVLIVDNDLDYAAQTAAKLEEIRPSLLNNNRLEIELTNNAYFAAERLQKCPKDQPAWDIVIADVYMPIPSRLPKSDVAEAVVMRSEFKFSGRTWPLWKYTYRDNSAREEKLDHGGLHIAATVAARLAAGESMSDLKLILMSNCLFGEERALLLDYQGANKAWFRYYDKADWRREKLAAWPSTQVEPDVFQWALFLAIAERHLRDWGGSILENIPDVQAMIGNTVTTELDLVIRNSWRLGRETDIETVLITGEVGTGREVFAQLIHKVRMQSLHTEGAFVGIDCSAIPHEAFEQELLDCVEESAGGTLFIDEVDRLTPPHQGRIYHLLRDKRIRSADRLQTVDFPARLAICTASGSNLEELNRGEMFHADLYFLLKDEQLHILPLRERPGDAVSIAEVLAQQAGRGVTLAPDALRWIETYHWPGNNKELRGVVTSAARRELTSVLTADDLQRVVKTGGTIPVKNQQTEIIPRDAPPQIKNSPPQIKNFRAEPPFQLHWGDSVLIDRQKRPIPLADDLYRVLKELLRTEEGQHGFIRGRLTFAQIADLYKGAYDEDHAEVIARRFVQNLRRFLEHYGVGHRWLITTWKGHGYKLGLNWDEPPVIYASEPSLVLTNNLEKVERDKLYKAGGRKKKFSPEH